MGIRTGFYKDRNGETVHVTRTESGGYVVRYADGTTTVVGGSL